MLKIQRLEITFFPWVFHGLRAATVKKGVTTCMILSKEMSDAVIFVSATTALMEKKNLEILL